MPEYQKNSIVRALEQVNLAFYRLTLSAPLIASSARPGQFVMAAVSGSSLDPLLRRPFSIHRCIDAESIQILFRVIGRGTQLLSEIRPGDSLSLIGPLGQGFQKAPEGPVCLIGGGIGLAPLLFLADSLGTSGQKPPCIVLLGARTSGELTSLSTEFSDLDCRVETATDDGSLGHHGLITDLLRPHLSTLSKVYVCGPHPMMAAVASLCQAAKVACEVSLEAHMACGLGACLGCTVQGAGNQYQHVCKDGPVFKAEDIAWVR